MSLLLAQAATAANGGDDAYLLWAFVLLGASIVLLFLELFVPSGGLIGLLAGVSAIGSVIAFFSYDTTWGIVAASSYIVLAPIVGVFLFKWWLNSPLAGKIILGGNDSSGADSAEQATMASEHSRQERMAQLRQLIGAEGVTVTPLHPVGTVKIEGQRIDAMAETGVIDTNTPVFVIDVYDNQVKVRPK